MRCHALPVQASPRPRRRVSSSAPSASASAAPWGCTSSSRPSAAPYSYPRSSATTAAASNSIWSAVAPPAVCLGPPALGLEAPPAPHPRRAGRGLRLHAHHSADLPPPGLPSRRRQRLRRGQALRPRGAWLPPRHVRSGARGVGRRPDSVAAPPPTRCISPDHRRVQGGACGARLLLPCQLLSRAAKVPGQAH